MWVGGWEFDYSVCPHPLLQFLQFRSVRLCQFTLEGRDVELDNYPFLCVSWDTKSFELIKVPPPPCQVHQKYLMSSRVNRILFFWILFYFIQYCIKYFFGCVGKYWAWLKCPFPCSCCQMSSKYFLYDWKYQNDHRGP